ncbi:hypothetical protein GF360_03585 [candidate division WWE3 bacterium]|nr:hypothetical protein [candidate division WWE3 bacterium]
MKKIIASIATIAVFASVTYLGTSALFSDTEESLDNTFTTGSIDISVDGENPWAHSEEYNLTDMKPGYTDYMEFVIHNVGTNPAEITKTLSDFTGYDVVTTEPECDAESGTEWTWDEASMTGVCTGNTAVTDLENVIDYDLIVEVYDVNPDEDETAEPVWMQTIYTEDQPADMALLDDQAIHLGMLPVGYYMKVTQSYHMDVNAGNEYQADELSFDIQLAANQLLAENTVKLENKDGDDDWMLIMDDAIEGTLTYQLRSPTFEFEFDGTAPLASRNYVLAAGYDADTNVDTKLGEGTSAADGTITITGDVELGKDMKDVKVWLVPAENWTDGTGMTGWAGTPGNFLWETSLMWYEDTNN